MEGFELESKRIFYKVKYPWYKKVWYYITFRKYKMEEYKVINILNSTKNKK